MAGMTAGWCCGRFACGERPALGRCARGWRQAHDLAEALPAKGRWRRGGSKSRFSGDWLIGCAPRTRPAPDWGAHSTRLGGRLVRPGNPLYDGVSQPLNQRARERCARRRQVGRSQLRGRLDRSGTGDQSERMQQVDVDDGAGTVTAQSGARNTGSYEGLQPHGVAISAGRCPTVAIGGLVLGGGIGFSSRKLGDVAIYDIAREWRDAASVFDSFQRWSRPLRTSSPLAWVSAGKGGRGVGHAPRSYRPSASSPARSGTCPTSWRRPWGTVG